MPEMRTVCLAVLVAAGLCGSVSAQNPGLEDLDRATELKLTARSLSDLAEVIQRCESALEKGLDDDHKSFAEQLLASTRIRRGVAIGEEIFKQVPPPRMWPQLREIALRDLESALELTPAQVDALQMVARLNMLPKGDRDRAREALKQAVEVSEEDPRGKASSLILMAALEEGKESKLEVLTRALKADPDSAEALRLRGSLHADMGQRDKALADLRKSVELKPDHPLTRLTLGMVLFDEATSSTGESDEARTKRDELLDEAFESFAETAKLVPKSGQALLYMGQIQALRSKFEEALESLDKAIELSPGDHSVLLMRALLMRASVYQELGKIDLALADVRRALENPEMSGEARSRVKRFEAMLLAGSDNIGEAIDVLKDLKKESPDDAKVLLQLGLFHASEEDFEKAIEAFTEVLEKDPKNNAALRLRSSAYLSLGDYSAAIADLEKAAELYPEDLMLLLQLGTAYTAAKQYDKAAATLTTVLEKDPENNAAFRLRGDAYLSLGKHPEALADLEKAAELMPEDSGTLNNLAWLLCTSPSDELRDGERAIEIATKACDLTEYKAAHILSTLAAAYAESGDMESALEWSRKAIEVAKSGEQDDPEMLGHLRDELKSYEQGKPWRELMTPESEEGDSEDAEAPPAGASESPKPSDPKSSDPKSSEEE